MKNPTHTTSWQVRALFAAGAFAFAVSSATGQTAFSDDFNRANVNTGTTTPSTAIGNGWGFKSDTQSPERGGAQIISNILQIGQNTAGGYAGAGGSDRSWLWQDSSTWVGPYTSTLKNNLQPVVWTFNMRTGHSDPTPVSASGGGTVVAFLATAEPGSGDWMFGGTATGYFVTYNASGTGDPLKLVKTSAGLRNDGSNSQPNYHTPIIIAATAPFNDLSNQFLSVKVTYDPASDRWQLFARNDGASFQDPAAGSLTFLGTEIDNTYTNTPLPYSGFLANSNNGFSPGLDENTFDNFKVSVLDRVGTPNCDPGGGNYDVVKNIIITSTPSDATIRYTTDGSDPSLTNGLDYTGPVSVGLATTVLKTYAYKAGYTDSDIRTETYNFQVSDLVFTPTPGTYPNTQNVAISTSTTGTTIYYTTDNSPPTTSSTEYTGPVEISTTTTLKAIAVKAGLGDSNIKSGEYIIKTGTPIFSPVAGTYDNTQTVTISTPTTTGASIRYTTNGDEPTPTSGTLYTDPVSITESTTLKAIAYKDGIPDSDVASANYVLKVSNPVFTPLPTTYNTAQTVTISTPTADATIRYTTNGIDPTPSSGTVYTVPITVSSTSTLKAIAYKTGYSDSGVTSGAYVIDTSVATVFEDTFADGGRTNGTDPLDGEWRLISNVPASTATVVGGAFKMERTTSTSTGFNPHPVTTFSAQTLTTGQIISMSFKFQSLGSAQPTGIRFGIYNSGGTNLSGDNSSATPGTTFQNDLGYSVFAPHQGTQNITLYSRPSNSTNNTLHISAGANTTVIGSQAAASATNTATVYSAGLTLERTSSGYNYSVNYAGTSFNGSTTIVNTDTFDTLSVWALTGQNQAFTIDDVKVTVTTPPPPNTLVSWRTLQGLAADGSQDLLNPSSDGVVNLMKYALNLAPNAGDLALSNNHPLSNPNGTTVAELTGLPVLALNGTPSAVFTYIRRKASSSPGITYSVLWSDALTAWAVNPSATETTLSLDATYERVTLTDSFTTTQKPKRFARLNVQSVP